MKAFLDTTQGMPYCKGCGHPHVLEALDTALQTAGVPAHRIALVTDIGCVGLADAQLVVTGFSGTAPDGSGYAAAVFNIPNDPQLDGLQAFIDAYRSVHPYDPAGTDHAARLTIDLAAGDRWLIALTERATAQWLRTDDPVLDYANAMVTPRQSSADAYMGHWQEHIDGKPQYDPPIPPLAPAKLTGSLWLTGRRPEPECVDFENSLQHPSALGDFVQTITPNGAGTSHGMLGFMFWAAECQGTRAACTTPEDRNTCEGGMGAAADHYDGDGSFLFPMRPLKQE